VSVQALEVIRYPPDGSDWRVIETYNPDWAAIETAIRRLDRDEWPFLWLLTAEPAVGLSGRLLTSRCARPRVEGKLLRKVTLSRKSLLYRNKNRNFSRNPDYDLVRTTTRRGRFLRLAFCICSRKNMSSLTARVFNSATLSASATDIYLQTTQSSKKPSH